MSLWTKEKGIGVWDFTGNRQFTVSLGRVEHT